MMDLTLIVARGIMKEWLQSLGAIEVTLGYNPSGKVQQQYAVMEHSLMMYKSKRIE